MTEKEAAETWCPKAKMGEPRLNADDRDSVRHDRCIGPKCAWWRWDVDKNRTRSSCEGFKGLEAYHGYCGVAGRP
jgi:hypothetical protein